MNKSIIAAAIACALTAALGVAVWCVLKSIPRKDPTAEIYQNGVLIHSMPLDVDAEFTVECAEGYNVVRVENGAVSVSEADCPDKVCMRTGAISGGAVPIVCLPHRLEICVVDGEDSIDAAV